MSIKYKQLQAMVKEAMFTGGGINEPSAPEGVPHRMGAAGDSDRQQNMGDTKANKLYEFALAAREATEILVEKLDEPIYDAAYEHAFKASAALRRALNSLEDSGAHPMPMQRVVAPPRYQQKWSGGLPGDYAGGGMMGDGDGGGLQEADLEPDLSKIGNKRVTQGAQAQATTDRAKEIRSGNTLGGIDTKERGILQQIEAALTDIAEKDDLSAYRPLLQNYIRNLLKLSAQNVQQDKPDEKVTNK